MAGVYRRIRPVLVTAVLAHMAGSYCFAAAGVLGASGYGFWGNVLGFLAAPLIAIVYFPFEGAAELPQFHAYFAEYWAWYTLGFVAVCVWRRKTGPAMGFAAVAVVLLAAIVLLVRWEPAASDQGAPDLAGLVNTTAKNFVLTALDGTTRSLADEKGHVVLLDFWFVGCPGCRMEFKQFTQSLAADAGLRDRGLRVWTINVEDDADAVRKFMEENQYDFPVLLDTSHAVSAIYAVDECPTTYLIGRDGLIREASSGFYEDTEKVLRGEIEEALR